MDEFVLKQFQMSIETYNSQTKRFTMSYELPGKRKVCRKSFTIAYNISERSMKNASNYLKEANLDDPKTQECNPSRLEKWDDDYLHALSYNDVERILYENVGEGK